MSQPPPPGWGEDTITKFLDNFRGNQFATFANKWPDIRPLIEIDSLYLRFLSGAQNPEPLLPFGYLFRAHSAYRAAVGVVLAGQIYEAPALLRLCLEHSAYSIFIGNDSARWERWMSRHESDETKQSLINEFSHRKIRAHLKRQSASIGDRFSILYEQTIDYGAHPNEKGYSLSSSMRETEKGDTVIESVYLHGDSIALDFGIQQSKDVGILSLQIAQLSYPAKFDFLGITQELESLSKQRGDGDA